jgi:ketosteroid isomerase-like protein
MPRENLETVRLAFEAWNNDDVEAALAFIHPDADWNSRGVSDLFIGVEPEHHGHAGVRAWWQAAKEPWAYFKSHIEQIVEEADTVVTAVRFEAVGRESGAKVGLALANLWQLEDGLIVRFAAYYSLADALEAAGIQS